MKKIFTLIAAALLSSGAFAQSEWVNLVVNGNMEGEQDAKWSSFWCHDWRRGLGDFDPESGQKYDNDDPENGQFQGFAEIIVDPLDPNNHCARVVARSEAEADEAGNKVAADGKLASWDCQFFVYATDTIPTGKELRMTLKVRAEKDGFFETQAHWAPGDYNHYQLFGNVNVTTEWQKIEVSAIIDGNHTQAANGKFMQSVAFNLSTNAEGNTFYFDDVKLEMRTPKQGSEEFTGWFNMLRHGINSADDMGSGRTNFTGRDGIDNTDRVARIVNDPVDGQPALNVTSIGWNATKVNKKEVKDEEGNPVLDEQGNPTYEEEIVDIYVGPQNDTLTSIDNWRTQFFVTIPHKFVANSKYRLVLWARADKPAQIESQTHAMPGDYIHYVGVGNLDLTEEWQQFVFDDMTVSNEQSGNGRFQTMAFNCNVPKIENNYYFRVEEFSANAADVTDQERTLGSETVALPIPEPDKKDGVQATIDFKNCMAKLEATSFENLVNENMSALNGEDSFGTVDATAGFFMADNGWMADDGKIIFEFDEVSDDNPVLTVNTYNEGESFAGKTAETAFRFEFNNWFYLFNVTLMSEESYNGVSDVKLMPAKSTAIYDLSGRRVQQATKGLYIQNGKKFFVK